MTVFKYGPTVDIAEMGIITTALGVNAAGKFVQNDINKPVKQAANSNHVLVAAGDEIEGFAMTVEPSTVNDGFSWGTIQTCGRVYAKVGAGEGAGTVAVGEYVVADTPSALGTKDAYPLVKEGTPTTFKWRCIQIESGTGAAGSIILIERVGC